MIGIDPMAGKASVTDIGGAWIIKVITECGIGSEFRSIAQYNDEMVHWKRDTSE